MLNKNNKFKGELEIARLFKCFYDIMKSVKLDDHVFLKRNGLYHMIKLVAVEIRRS